MEPVSSIWDKGINDLTVKDGVKIALTTMSFIFAGKYVIKTLIRGKNV
jgi:hypothetical protein